MKLLLVQPYLLIKGGMERVILKVAEHYDAPIYTLEYKSHATYPEFRELDVRIIGKNVPLSSRLPYRASQGLRYGYNFYNMKLQEDYDVINAHMSPSEWVRHKNERVLWYCHTPPREVYDLYKVRMKSRSYKQRIVYAAMAKAYKFMAHRIVDNIEGIATNSTVTKERIYKYFSRDSTVINPGIEYEKYNNDSDKKFFLYPSRMVINKRHEYAIDAFKKFAAKSKDKSYKLVLAGTLSKDPEHNDYYNKICGLAKGSRIEIKANISESELRKLYANCTATLFTAINEDYGYVPLEAMASSKPIISVNEGGPRETIINGDTGFLVNSVDEMSEKMLFISKHKDFAEEMGSAGRKRVIEKYSWGNFFKKFDKALAKTAKHVKEQAKE